MRTNATKFKKGTLSTQSSPFFLLVNHFKNSVKFVINFDFNFCVLKCSAITNQMNETDVYSKLIMKQRDISGRQRDCTGISPDTRTDIIAKLTNVVIAKK